MMIRLAMLCAPLLFAISCTPNSSDPEKDVSSASSSALAHFVFIGDPHYGEFRDFREDGNVPGSVVNAALVSKLNTLSAIPLPDDRGVGAGDTVGAVDFVLVAGDLLDKNVVSKGIDSIKATWKQFSDNYLKSIVLLNREGAKTPVHLMVGNHDVPNAFVMSQIYNRSFQPETPLDETTYEYKTGRVHYSMNWAGVHLAILNIWPDSTELEWLERDLRDLPKNTPVLLFAHDPTKVESAHFSNPAGAVFGGLDPFDNLLDPYKDGPIPGESALIEERTFTNFLQRHPEVKAYFHGHNNFQEFYTYQGPDKSVNLPIFRVDSPTKGQVSESSEERLSFQVVTLDTLNQQMTVRECLWNANPANAWEPIRWGATMTLPLR